MKAVLFAAVSTIAAAAAWAEAEPKYDANVPPSITTPDTVQTRIGTLKFHDGLPDEATVQKVYDNLDFARGVEAFMAGIPATSVQALKHGFIEGRLPAERGHRHHRKSRGRPLGLPDAERDSRL